MNVVSSKGSHPVHAILPHLNTSGIVVVIYYIEVERSCRLPKPLSVDFILRRSGGEMMERHVLHGAQCLVNQSIAIIHVLLCAIPTGFLCLSGGRWR
jgi:hypothetical protein